MAHTKQDAGPRPLLQRLQRACVLEPDTRAVGTAMHVPRGQCVPDLNRIVCPYLSATVPSSVCNSVADSRSFANQSPTMRDRATASDMIAPPF